jgi:hypothetical protein
MNLKKLIYVSIVLLVSSSIIAVPVEVGSGQNQAGLFVMWSDGYSVEFKVNFDSNTTGLELLETVDTELADNFTVTTKDWGWGITIEGIEYIDNFSEIHFNPGYIDGENWWHYWNKNAGEAEWTFSWVGCSARLVNDGDCDGWVYGFNTIPEPATILLFGSGIILLRRRKK